METTIMTLNVSHHMYNKPFVFDWTELNFDDVSNKLFCTFSGLDEIDDLIEDIKNQYDAQSKTLLQSDLPWIKASAYIKPNDCVCFYCGINEQILSELYNDQNYTCKTKRNRGAWFELDRKDSSKENNIYSKENMVLCCYFCNNHKSDVVSSEIGRAHV